MKFRAVTGLVVVMVCWSIGVSAQTHADRKLVLDERKEEAAITTRALTWLTGSTEENDYVSVGRLANYFGFVRFRVGSGHTISRGHHGQLVLAILDADQRRRLRQLLDSQFSALEACRLGRERINRKLEGLLLGEPVDRDEVVALGREFGRLEAGLGLEHARGFAAIIASLSAEQREALGALRKREPGGGRDESEASRAVRREIRDLTGIRKQEFLNLASRLFTWLTGRPEDNDFDTAGKPSQHFGFVSLRIESGHGVTRGGVRDEIEALLDDGQKKLLADVVPANSADFDEYFRRRAAINRLLERGLVGEPIDGEKVLAEGIAQGEAEARMTWRMARAFLALRDGLSGEQMQAFMDLKHRHVAATTEVAPDMDPLEVGRQTYLGSCVLCHQPDERGRAFGPSLDGVVGRRIAALPDYDYTPAMRAYAQDGEWTEDRLMTYLADPVKVVPGTRMGFNGIDSAERRSALIRFLRERGGPAGQASSRPAAEVESASRGPAAAEAIPGATPPPEPPRSPNIILMVADDQSWDGLAVAMHPDLSWSRDANVATPSLAALAAAGMRFSAGYAPAPVCSPTRAAIQTGRNPAALRWTKAARSVDASAGTKLLPPENARELPAGDETVAEMLKARGYRCAHLGKWHIGSGGPEKKGYDLSDGDIGNEYAGRFGDPNPVDIFGMVERARAFMAECKESGRPFYLQMSWHALHAPENALAKTRARYEEALGTSGKRVDRLAIAEDLDTGVGRLLAALEELGLDRNTYVVYTTDNGGGGGGGGKGRRESLRGGKGSLYEGGIRVPFIVRGPGVPAGSWCAQPVCGTDLLPTFAELAGVRKLPSDREGRSLLPLLRGPGQEKVVWPERALVFHFPHYQGSQTPQSAIIRGSKKLIHFYEDDSSQLFDLEADIGETRDLAGEEPELAAALLAELRRRLEDMSALLPAPNPDHDPEKVPEPRRGGRRRR